MTMLKFSTATVLIAALGLGACTNATLLDNYNGDPNQNTKSGAIIGGILGASVGALSNSSNKTAAVLGGAALGAAAGGAIGYNLDQQAAELRQQLDNEGITIVNTGDRLIVSLPDDLTFASDSSAISASVRSDLQKIANSLLRYPDSSVQVIGHTDSDGDATYNQSLSVRRANAVADQVQAGGVPYNRVQTYGRGEDQPVASNLTVEGKAQNRRVEIVVIPQST
ncbi:OmpA family protein [Parasedimentitalea psychrophila]|uniref:OmpA family protein n=1 Tax=Parasedimentitalea psychrophila TaxID=2997337 RepID=A0A9Y2L490_9RHOB|nr:OmpA family protein [Parasedimentitalea psychrophila]WIY27127.1 OmpA family protein [Parasedimentitalea psychrophila]